MASDTLGHSILMKMFLTVGILSAFRLSSGNDSHQSGMDCIVGIKIATFKVNIVMFHGTLVPDKEC